MNKCWKCGSVHGNYKSIEEALDVVMEEANDGDCRMDARKWIIDKFKVRGSMKKSISR